MSYIDPRQKVLWHLDKLSQIKSFGTTLAPVNVEIDLSNRCSHGCAWCHFAHTHTRGPWAGKAQQPEGMEDCGDLMGFDLANSIIRQLVDAGVQSVTWSGGGEPTLHPKFDTIVEHAALAGLQQGLYTHGGHIDQDRAALLRRLMTFIYVSLDECDEVKFKQSKGVDRYWAVSHGIDNLVAANGKAAIGIGFLLHPGNVEDIDDMVALGKIKGVDYVQFRPVIDYDQDTPGALVGDTDRYLWVNYAMGLLRKCANDPFVVADLDRFRMYRDWTGHGYSTCNWAALQTVITPNGKVWRCVNRRGHSGALLGDLTEDAFVDIWARSGGSCAVGGDCRLMCRGHLSNLTLDAIMTEPAHCNFV